MQVSIESDLASSIPPVASRSTTSGFTSSRTTSSTPSSRPAGGSRSPCRNVHPSATIGTPRAPETIT